MFKIKVKHLLPDHDDLSGAVEGLLRLQTIYRLDCSDFANGIIDGVKTREPLSAHDLFVTGEEASKLKDQEYFAIEYLRAALKKVNEGYDPDNEVNVNILLHLLATCCYRTGYYDHAISTVDLLTERNPESQEYIEIKNQLLTDLEKFWSTKLSIRDPYSDYYLKDGIFTQEKENIIYSQVCRGSLTKSPKELSMLRCRYASNNHFTKLARFKVEEVNLDPSIVLFVDMLSYNEVEFLKLITKPFVKPPEGLTETMEIQKSSYRVAQSAAHHEKMYNDLTKITQRREASVFHISLSVSQQILTL